MSTFKNKFTFEKRKEESSRIMEKYIDRKPIIIEKHHKCTYNIDKNKYLVPIDLTVGQLLYVVRRRLKLTSDKAIFVFCNKIMPPTSQYINELYKEHKDIDGFLYIEFTDENAFGYENAFG